MQGWLKRSRVTLICGLLMCFADGAGAQAPKPAPQPVNFAAGTGGQINFVLPSQNIGCTFTPKGGTGVYQPFDGGPELSCDRVAPQYVRVVLTPKNSAVSTMSATVIAALPTIYCPMARAGFRPHSPAIHPRPG